MNHARPLLLIKNRRLFPWLSRPGTEWLLFTFLAALILRAWKLNDQSFTMDEVTEISTVDTETDFIDLFAGRKRFPPVYFLLLRGWLGIFPTDTAARWLSVAIGLVSILVIWRLAVTVAGKGAGLWTATFVAISPFHIWYSQESRVYGLYLLLAGLSILMWIRALKTDRAAYWSGFVITAALGIFTHYYTGILVAILGVMTLALRRNRAELIRPLIAFAAIGVLSLPVLVLLAAELDRPVGFSRFSTFGPFGIGYSFVSFMTGYTLGPSLRELHYLSKSGAIFLFLPWLIAILFILGVLAVHGYKALPDTRSRFLLGVTAIVPILVVVLISEFGPMGFKVRHVVWTFVPFAVWMGAGLTRWRHSRSAAVAGILLAGLSLTALFNRQCVDRYRNEDARAVARSIDMSNDSAPLFVSSGYMAEPIEYYLETDRPVRKIPAVSADGIGVAAALARITSNSDHDVGYWFAYSREFHGDPGGVLISQLINRDGIKLYARFAGFRLYRCQPRPSGVGTTRMPPP